MKVEYLIGLLAGLAIGGILLALIFKVTKKDGSMKCKYDERQQIIRGKGFKYAFFTLVFYNFLAAVISGAMEKQYIKSEVLMIAGILIGVLVYASYCIWNEGYFSINENPKRVMIAFAIIAVINIGLGISNILHHRVFENGVLTIHCLNLLCAMMMVMIFLVLAVKYICKQREEE